MGRERVPAGGGSRRQAVEKQIVDFSAVGKKLTHWKPAREVLTKIEAQKTIFPWVNHGTRVGGWPMKSITVIHGPSAQGKSMFALGLELSYLRAGQMAFHIDAEFATPGDWTAKLLGEHAASDAFRAMRPRSYEETQAAVREIVEAFDEAKREKLLAPDARGIVVVDSLQKLVPAKVVQKLEDGDGGIGGANGMLGMIQAAMNNDWLKQITPIAYHANLSFVLIARESQRAKKFIFDEDFKLVGGNGVNYDSNLTARILVAGMTKIGSDENSKVIGERHLVEIRKSRVAAKDGKFTKAYFYTSNGKVSAEGFDTARDYAELGIELGAIKKSGARYSLGGENYHGVEKLVAAFREHPELCEQIEQRIAAGEVE